MHPGVFLRSGVFLSTVASIVALAFADGVRPEKELLVSEWADTYRIMGKTSPEPGPWDTARVPYTREIMDNFSPASPVEMTVLMKAAQGAGTEVILNAIGAVCAQFTGDVLFVSPTLPVAKKLSKRFADMVEATPSLRDKVGATQASTTIYSKPYAGGTVFFAGANSAAGLRSDPIRFLTLDEIDGYPSDVQKEGNAIDLALARTDAFRNRKVLMVSTPTNLGASNIHTHFLAGDQRFYFVPCPNCKHEQKLIWYAGKDIPGGIRWPKGEPSKVYYECASCQFPIPQFRRTWMLDNGHWEPAAPNNGAGRVRSYQISKLYYPHGWPGADWANMAAKWESVHRDPVRLKTFVNLSLGEPWEDKNTQKADSHSLMGRREGYGSGRAGDDPMPEGIAVVTAGVDVQQNRLEIEVVGWGHDQESWSLGDIVLPGDTAKPAVWEDLDRILLEDYESENGIRFPIKAVCVDTHFNAEIATGFCAARFHRRVWAIQGKAGKYPVWKSTPGKSKYSNRPVFTIGVDNAKEAIYARLNIAEPGPGYCHFPSDRDRDYFDQLTAETRVPVYGPSGMKWVWKKKNLGDRNEKLDIRVYAYAALESLVASGLRLNYEVARIRATVQRNIEGAGAGPVPPIAPPVVVAAAQRRAPRFQYRAREWSRE